MFDRKFRMFGSNCRCVNAASYGRSQKTLPDVVVRGRAKILALVQGKRAIEIHRGGLCSVSEVYRIANRFVENGLAELADRREDNGNCKVTRSIVGCPWKKARRTRRLREIRRMLDTLPGRYLAISNAYMSKSRRAGAFYRTLTGWCGNDLAFTGILCMIRHLPDSRLHLSRQSEDRPRANQRPAQAGWHLSVLAAMDSPIWVVAARATRRE